MGKGVMAKISELQTQLDKNYERTQDKWNQSLTNLNMAGDFSFSDAQEFLQLTTMKSTRNWAVSQELSANHEAQKKIIDSL
jgi:UDP-galactopyranose mutase